MGGKWREPEYLDLSVAWVSRGGAVNRGRAARVEATRGARIPIEHKRRLPLIEEPGILLCEANRLVKPMVALVRWRHARKVMAELCYAHFRAIPLEQRAGGEIGHIRTA